ncbi:MAG: sensor histidine kinase [Chitinophagaceae bacterium]
MNFVKKNKLALVTAAYWFLLLYIVAALFWWFIALNNQNNSMAATQLSEINKDDIAYSEKAEKIISIQKRKTTQYIGEGLSFLAVILFGAVFIYRATRKQIKFGEQQQNFMMAITHELKTPIAVVQLNLETIQKRKLDTDKQDKITSNSLLELDRLNKLCNNILWSAQLDAGAYHSKKEEINLSDIVAGCVEDFEKRMGKQKIHSNISEGIYIDGDILMMQILTNNLIENAIKYSSKEKPVFINLEVILNKILLTVKDEGIGIVESERDKIFDKFYRSGSEQTRKTKGTGLGLYLCNKIVKKHNGTITASNNNPIGTTFTVTLYQ